MSKLPAIKGAKLIKLESIGFKIIRTKGSHVRLQAEDGRVTTVPIHGGKDVPSGLLRKIIKEDLEISVEEFLKFYTGSREDKK